MDGDAVLASPHSRQPAVEERLHWVWGESEINSHRESPSLGTELVTAPGVTELVTAAGVTEQTKQ